MNAGAWIGLSVMAISEAATLRHIEPFWSWNTPIAWTGFILFADSIVWREAGASWLRSRPGEFVLLALASIPLWIVFEGYNLVIRNWYYTGLPETAAMRLFGYGWSFATIWPAIFEGADLVAVWTGAAAAALPTALSPPSAPRRPSAAGWASIAAGAMMLAAPFVVSPELARFMAAPVWLGFVFLLDPLNAWLGGDSLGDDLARARFDRVATLAPSGLLCGLLWEFWNYWSRAKWHYTVPIMERTKIFEMPLPGYLGFPAFALECFTMYVFVRALCLRVASRRTVS